MNLFIYVLCNRIGNYSFEKLGSVEEVTAAVSSNKHGRLGGSSISFSKHLLAVTKLKLYNHFFPFSYLTGSQMRRRDFDMKTVDP